MSIAVLLGIVLDNFSLRLTMYVGGAIACAISITSISFFLNIEKDSRNESAV